MVFLGNELGQLRLQLLFDIKVYQLPDHLWQSALDGVDSFLVKARLLPDIPDDDVEVLQHYLVVSNCFCVLFAQLVSVVVVATNVVQFVYEDVVLLLQEVDLELLFHA